MKISVIANTKTDSETFGFIFPIAELDVVSKIIVFGENHLQEHDKVEYSVDKIKNPKIIKLFFRLLNIIKNSRKCDFIIGIYEVPHGFFAYMAGLLLKKKSILCIIGNPAYSLRRKGLRKRLLDIMISRMDATTITGSRSKAYLEEIGHKPEKLFVLPNSINLSIFKCLESQKKYDIISLGQLNPEKELINMLRVILLVKNIIKDIKFGVAGSGPELENIKSFVGNHGLSESVDVLGYVKDKIGFYNSGKLFLLTSSTEGLPRTIIESMSCGTPCISSNVGDISDLIIDDETGFLVENFNDIERYASIIVYLLNNEAKRKEISQKAMEYVGKEYSHLAASKFWEYLFNNLKNNCNSRNLKPFANIQ
ncbi:MAG TPA: glycosyltransferase family 4 protein [Ignavibacteriaceae bacterium]|nr:glycosyltransferase family 4 protein [Ignavibacteriaceae bacterium]